MDTPWSLVVGGCWLTLTWAMCDVRGLCGLCGWGWAGTRPPPTRESLVGGCWMELIFPQPFFWNSFDSRRSEISVIQANNFLSREGCFVLFMSTQRKTHRSLVCVYAPAFRLPSSFSLWHLTLLLLNEMNDEWHRSSLLIDSVLISQLEFTSWRKRGRSIYWSTEYLFRNQREKRKALIILLISSNTNELWSEKCQRYWCWDRNSCRRCQCKCM